MPAFQSQWAFLARTSFIPVALGLLMTASSGSLLAQRKVPIVNAPQGFQANHTEIELVDVRQRGAWPHHLQRKAGKFILLVINDTPDLSAAFVLEPAGVADGALGPNPILRIGAPGEWIHDHRLAALFDATTGNFDLKSAVTGKILCTITIE
jgi:hypothetical protein